MQIKWMITLLVSLIMAFALTGMAQSGLVASWSFNSNSTDTIFDESGNEYHGALYGAGRTSGIDGNALVFDGEDDYARIPKDGAAPPEAFANLEQGSISLWFKVDRIPVQYGIAPMLYYGAEEKCDFFDAANQGLIIELGHSPVHNRSERLYFTIWEQGCTYPSFCFDSREAIPESQWMHFVAVVGEDYNTGYLNGEEMDNRRYNFGTPDFSQFFANAVVHEKMWLGKGYWDRTTQFYDGAIDELRIYNRPLSAAEVNNLFQNPGLATGLHKAPGKSNFRMYPNPANKRLQLSLGDEASLIRQIKIRDMSGKLMLQKRQMQYQQSVDISGLAEGTYFVTFRNGERRFKRKFVVQR